MSWSHSQRSIMWQTAPSRGQRCKCHLSGETVQGFYCGKWRLTVLLRFIQLKKLRFVILSRPRGPPPLFFFLKEQLTQKWEFSHCLLSPPVRLDSQVKFHSWQNVSGASQQCSPKQLMWKEIQISALKSVQIKTFQFNLESWSSIGYVPGLTAYELISVAARHKRKTKVSSMY